MPEQDSKPFGYIYCAYNLITEKCYVGQTSRSIDARWKQHCSRSNKTSLLTMAVTKYGPSAFVVDELDTANSRQELNAKEVFYIKLLGAKNRKIGYNLAEGGGVVYRQLSESHKARIGAANIGRVRGPLGEEQRKKIGDAHRGVPKVVSPEAKIRMAEMLSNREYSAETRQKMSESHKGKVQSEETKAKRADAHRGRKNTDETKRKMSEAATGKVMTEAHRASLRAASKLRWERYRLEKAARI